MKNTIIILGAAMLYLGMQACTPQALEQVATPQACCGDDFNPPPPPPPPPPGG
ncbi:hypothetical protein ATE92_0570 [Ulvibacter sp. MAR_2010_11]|uniref:hypothetical protein n=1 Tax=Ulvibacter sp. MAR_2010_11 TaxID=1250229 RepID=UPI000CC88A55|nr:hypothetical protein [Ulvibacter sp. MAR_2010_11]PKA82441.1 hypothetical protein ATE92_0570 [Ulvibacter sp. MAR_2010_11]